MKFIGSKRTTDSVTVFEFQYESTTETLPLLLTADWHWDNPHCDRGLLRKHLKEIKKKNGYAFCFGDLFCAMQGKYDRRGNKQDVRPEHAGKNYLDRLVSTAAEWLKPYKDNMLFVSPGNHETAIEKHHETDLINRLCNFIGCKAGSYAGYVVLKFRSDKDSSGTQKFIIAYNHGYGGGGPVTKGTIQSNRRAVYVVDADMIVTGHIHERWELTTMQERITNRYQNYIKPLIHLQLPTYKEEYLQGDGYHREKGRPPKPLGGCYMDLTVNPKSKKVDSKRSWAE